MARINLSRIFPIILVIIIVIIAVAALVSLTRAVFFSASTSTTAPAADTSRTALLSTTADRSVRMTVRGAIVADESFRSYQIVITPSSRTLTTYTGYLDTKVDQVSLSNNIPSYDQFVHALDKANLTKGTSLTGDKNDTRGVCATGRLFEFDVLNASTSVKNLWTSTCSGSTGPLDASATQLTNLFDAQLPTAQTLIRKINLE
jgi:hypothetical protein